MFINNSQQEQKVPWTRFKEISARLGAGRNVLTGENMTLTDETTVPALSTLVVEFQR